MPDDLVIRDLEPADVEAAVEIAVAAWEPVYDSYRRTMGEELFAAAHPDWRAEKAGQIRSACEPRDQAGACVAEVAGRVVGFVTFYAFPGTGIGEIGNNAVRPDFQNRGIATRMYAHACRRLRELGMRFAAVGTGGDPVHAPARRAYEKAGFSIRLPGVKYYRKL